MIHSQSTTAIKNEHLEAVRIAAYFFKKLKKPQVKGTDISSSVDEILKDEVQITCRIFGYLLLGIVRIYSMKVEYMLYDCREVLQEITNFVVRSRKEELPEETRTQKAPYFSIILPETYELDAFDIEVVEDAIDVNVLPQEEITLKESFLEKTGTKEHALDMCLYEDISGGYYPCSVMYSPFDDILSSYGIDVNLRNLLNIDGLTTAMEIVKENNSYQRESVMEEEHQNIDMTQNKDCQDDSKKNKDPEILLKDIGGNDAKLVGSPEVEVVANEDLLIGKEHTMVLEPEHLENESDSQANIEKLLHNVCSGGGRFDHDVRELVDSVVSENPEDGEPMLCEIPNAGESHHSGKEDNPVSKISTDDIEIPHGSDLGAATPQFVGLSTPAPKERPRKSNKRNCVIDGAIILPMEVMKQRIHDASDLVSKRRKLAHTVLGVWRTTRPFPRIFFVEPLLTGIAQELRSLYYEKKYKAPKSFKTMVPLEKLDISKITSPGISLEQLDRSFPDVPERVDVVAPATPVPCSRVVTEQLGIAPETPVQSSTATRPVEHPPSPGTPNYESLSRPSFFESPRRDLSPGLDLPLDVNLMDEVTSSHSGEESEWNGWSGRTRLVAKYLRRGFQKLEERAAEEILHLSRVVEGKTKKESARCFYEVLVLSSKGFVGVKQDESYGDILVRKLQKFDRESLDD